MTPRLGLAFTPDLPPEALPALAQACDQHLDDLWVWEDCFKESGVASSAVALAQTSRVRVGLGLMPTPLRNVALTAMEVATLQRLFPGRFVPGIGHGVQEWMAQVGNRVDSPMTLLEEYSTALRALLDGEEITCSGRYVTLDTVRLEYPPAAGAPLFVGGTGPRTLEMAGRRGDGTILAWTPYSRFDRARNAVTRGVGKAGGSLDDHEIVLTVIVATGPDAAARAEAEAGRWFIDAEPGVVATGSAEQIAAALNRHLDAGATTLVAQATHDEPDLEQFARFLGEQVRPLLGRQAA